MKKYSGKVIRSDSLDPTYKVVFSFSTEDYEINDATAIFVRTSPFPKVSFDDLTDYRLEKLEVDEETIKMIKLEVGNTVFDYIYSTMGSWK